MLPEMTKEERIAYYRSIIKRALPDHGPAMVLSPESWAEILTWALDELESVTPGP